MNKVFASIALLAFMISILFVGFSISASDNSDLAVPTRDDMHSYLVETRSGFTMTQSDSGVSFSKTGVTGYEILGTNYGVKTYKMDGLRLEFENISITSTSAGATPRISICLTPNTDGAIPRDSQNRGIVFVPAPDWYGAGAMLLYIGARDSIPAGFQQGAAESNVIRPFYTKGGSAPFSHVTNRNGSYTIQFNKLGDCYIIIVDDCAYYSVPAELIEDSIDNSGSASYLYRDLPAGNAVINILTWIQGDAVSFEWSGVGSARSSQNPDPNPDPNPTDPNPNPTDPESNPTDPGPTPSDPKIPLISYVHPYMTVNESGFTYNADEDGITFVKDSNLTGYEKASTNYDNITFKVDGLRLEFSNINFAGRTDSYDTIPRLSVSLTPYTAGAVPNAGPENYKGIIFIPAKGFFGNEDLIVYVGAMKDYPGEDEFAPGINVISPYHVNKGQEPFKHVGTPNSTYSIQFNKVGDEYIIVVDDCAFYKIPAELIDNSISLDVDGLPATAATFLKTDLQPGHAVLNFHIWTAGNSVSFKWTGVEMDKARIEPIADTEDTDTEPSESTKPTNGTDTSGEGPKTGESSPVYIVLACLIAGVLAVSLRKKESPACG